MPSKPEKRSEVKPEKKINAKQGRTHGLSQPLTGEESYKNDHLTHAAFVSIAILTFITFVGNFTQLQLSAALPTIVSDFGISVTTGLIRQSSPSVTYPPPHTMKSLFKNVPRPMVNPMP